MNTELNLEAKIEAILFWKGEPVTIKKLAAFLEVDEEGIRNAIVTLREKLASRGIVLIQKEDEVTLGTSPELSSIFEKLTKEELSRDLGKAGLETLSIVLYKGPIKRSEIDYIRGVNSNFILRNLLVRGLVEKIQAPDDQRAFLYKPTMELFSFLGITKIEDLPEYHGTIAELEQFVETAEKPIDNDTQAQA
jgi:segregation and condensation protein B